jgi:opacity protein-like surface antigen
MKKLLSAYALTTALALAHAGSATAADMPLKAPAPVPPAWSWTGIYTGVHVGGGWGSTSFLDNATAPIPPGSLETFNNLSGPLGGTQTGLRMQWGQVVLGVESTFSWADINQTNPTGSVAFPGETDSFGIRYMYTATGQLGFAWDWLLFYGKGGYGGGLANISIAAPGFLTGASQSRHLNGWTAGAGIEYMLLQNLSLGVEYDHYDMSYGAFGAAIPSSYTQLGGPVKIDSVVARVNIKSDWLSMLFR